MITKDALQQYISEAREEIFAMGETFFQCAELGFREFSTAEKITRLLDQWGIAYERQVALTGVIATVGTGDGYHIGIVADMDALPAQTSMGNVHACGHSVQTTIALAVLKALVDSQLLQATDCRVSVFFTPAEEYIDFAYREQLIASGKLEFLSGKQNMIALGCFDGVDCILSAHANGDKEARFDVGSTLTGFLVKKVIFGGKAAHTGAELHLGRNTLHGAVLLLNALGFVKDQFAPAQGIKISPVITEAGGTVNAVPDRTVVESYIRADSQEALYTAAKRFDACAEHCAAALELACTMQTVPGYLPLRPSAPLGRIVKENMLRLCTETEIVENPASGASGDIGDLSALLPAVQFGFAGIDGRFHDDSFRIADLENCYISAAQVMLGTVYDLVQDKAKRVYSEDYEEKKKMYLANLRNQ